ncbi:Mu-like prophage major head subunit gpT family protein [Aliarcobacter cryaerophilus]|uniref:phage major capsid protein n=1 Tax=Aliarcobacter cryaerophilus TaxID=28198 RepID=UPI0021B5A108|nr:Mu-like prophage major head subunit gpT family protein [Aliarcobacter cryaerophilus]MCT7510027.1 Mu-like prophage major head subunit gpT family protein [Aliarcobacter cryaerophilus]
MPKKKEELQRKLSGFDTQRNFVVDSSSINEENRTISFILVSEQNEGERYDWWTDEVFIEKLDVNGARYERLKTFFKDHNRSVDSAIGRVENIRLEDGKLKADVVFGTDEASLKIFRKYADGILTDCSIGYRILATTIEERKGEPTLVTVTEFEIFELSAVGVGFDKGATVGRELNLNTGDDSMNEQLRKELEQLRSLVDGLTAEQQTRKDELENIEKEAQRALNLQNEQKRTSEIMDLAAAGHLTLQRASELVKAGTPIDEVRKAVIDEKTRVSQVVVAGTPDKDVMVRHIEDSILSRCGVSVDLKDNNFRGATLSEMARYLLGVDSMDRAELAQRAMSNDQFSLLLGNIANRVLTTNFEEQEGTYHLWTTNVDLPNFKLQTDVGIRNPNGRLSKLKEKGELENLELDESGQAWKLESFGNKFTFTRQMLINDDLGAFSNIVAEFARMAKRTANGIVYDLLQSKGDFVNYKMNDNKALFHSEHKNMDNGIALDSDSLSATRTRMRRQLDGKTALNINPKYLLVSPENETIAKQLLTSESNPTSSNPGVANIHKNSFDLIIEAELEAKPWYLAAARRTIKTGTLAGTGGQPIVQERLRSGGGIEYECLFDFGVVVEDFRGLYKNLGA